MSDLLEDEESKQPKRPPESIAPLPRLWKSPGDETDEPEESDLKKRKRAKAEAAKAAKTGGSDGKSTSKKFGKKADAGSKSKKSKTKDGEGGTKGVLVEDTPELDTYETRQRIRIAIGAGLFGLVLLVGFVVYRTFAPASETGEDDGGVIEIAAVGTSTNSREKAEQEARVLYKRAVEVGKTSKPELAVDLLKRITKSYPSTTAAVEALEALDRAAHNLPLFSDTPTVIASPLDPIAANQVKKAATKIVEATKPVIPNAPSTVAGLVLPANPAEPSTSSGSNPPATNATPTVAMKPLPNGFHARPGTLVHPSGWPIEIVGDRDGAPMMLVIGSTFIQGRDDTDPAEGPAHQVTLGTYYIDVHEVTVRQFKLFEKEMGKLTERARAIAKDPLLANSSEDDDLPAVMVTAREASDFAAWAGKKLPTEAQWEAAARTPDGRIHPWGRGPADWSKPRAPRQIDPIRSYPLDVSPYGVFDLAGNAWEWTKDWYDPKYYQQFKTATANNPTGPVARPKSAQLVVKGTSKDWLASKRDGFRFDTRLPYLGFRCVLQVDGAGGGVAPAPRSIGGQGANDVPF